jgi:DNA-binding MarR family transcriptional regulator
MRNDEKVLFEYVQRVGSKFIALEKGFVFLYGETKLYASEIHLMKAVDYNPNVNASGLARLLGVTKGAVSQTVSRLVQKGVIVKERDWSHNNELKISLTSCGKGALTAFHTQNGSQWKDFIKYLDGLPNGEYQIIIGFLAKMEAFLDSLM